MIITGFRKEQMIYFFEPVNNRPWPTVGLMLRQRPNVNQHCVDVSWIALSIRLLNAVYTNCMHFDVGNHHLYAGTSDQTVKPAGLSSILKFC